jgi:hypothetical protein
MAFYPSEQPALWSFHPFHSLLTEQVCVNVYSVHGMPEYTCGCVNYLSNAIGTHFVVFHWHVEVVKSFHNWTPYDVTILHDHAKTWCQSLSNGFSNFSVCQITYGRCFVKHMGGFCIVLLLIFDTVMMVPCTFFPLSMCLSFITINHLPVREYIVHWCLQCLVTVVSFCVFSVFLCAPFSFWVLAITLSIYFLIQQAKSLCCFHRIGGGKVPLHIITYFAVCFCFYCCEFHTKQAEPCFISVSWLSHAVRHHRSAGVQSIVGITGGQHCFHW